MNKKTINDIVNTIQYCKNNEKPMPLILCGAGTSITGGIPLTSKIITDVFEQFENNPKIRNLKEKGCVDYYEIMNVLRPIERQDMFKKYITSSDVKINLASIYMSLLLKEKYFDYIFTVNFDDLLVKASAIFNTIPPIYDITAINNLTTGSFVKNSLTYLHGQYFGQWMFNTDSEINSGLSKVNNLFQRVCDRPWIIVGYSGEDKIFDEIIKIESFQHDLYWISYNDDNISENVKVNLLDNPKKNAHLVSNIDADTFFLQLATELKVEYPALFYKPFTFLESFFDKIQDFIETRNESQELYSDLKRQKEISLNWIKKAKLEIEDQLTIDSLIQEIISTRIRHEFSDEKAQYFENIIIKNNYVAANFELSRYYFDWGARIIPQSTGQNVNLYLEGIKKFEKVIQLDPSNKLVNYNWGIALYCLAQIKKDRELFEKSIEKFEKVENKNETIYLFWAISIFEIAKFNLSDDLLDCFKMFEKAHLLNKSNYKILLHWSKAIIYLAKLKKDKSLYLLALEKLKEARIINPKTDEIPVFWATILVETALLTKEQTYLEQAKELISIGKNINGINNESFEKLLNLIIDIEKKQLK